MTDRFRPDAAVRRVVPCGSSPVRVFGQSEGQIIDALSPPTYHSEVNKDRTGRHGSEVA